MLRLDVPFKRLVQRAGRLRPAEAWSFPFLPPTAAGSAFGAEARPLQEHGVAVMQEAVKHGADHPELFISLW
jgi:hypothetical protein